MRNDHDLAMILRYENIAWFDGGKVTMLDRRVYPNEERFVTCTTYQEVAKAIYDMVTQSYGPFQAACEGMALAAWSVRTADVATQRRVLTEAGDCLATARPTTERKMRVMTDACLAAAEQAFSEGTEAYRAIKQYTLSYLEDRYGRIAKIGHFLAEKLPMGGTLMTMCYPDCDFGLTLRALLERNNPVKIFCPETRPYFQGAKLTASVALDMGFDVTVISDNMPAWTMHTRGVDVFTTAADVITVDGHVVNKVGTLQVALAARHFGVPYYCTGNPNAVHPTADDVRIELRDPEEVTHAQGKRTCKEGVKGYYPAFDITPPELVTGIVTDRGILAPTALASYFA